MSIIFTSCAGENPFLAWTPFTYVRRNNHLSLVASSFAIVHPIPLWVSYSSAAPLAALLFRMPLARAVAGGVETEETEETASTWAGSSTGVANATMNDRLQP